jgi:hypothetical protein
MPILAYVFSGIAIVISSVFTNTFPLAGTTLSTALPSIAAKGDPREGIVAKLLI